MKWNLRWAFKTLILSIFLSIFFSMISQSIFPNLHASLSIFIIVFFIVISVIFDMLGVAVTSAKTSDFDQFKGKTGQKSAIWLCRNTEKVSSFCGDMVGDICSILSGAGGVSLVVNLNLTDANLEFLTTCITSALIAGMTIFGKAIFKGYAVKNHVRVVMLTGKLLEMSPKRVLVSVFRRIFGFSKARHDGKPTENLSKSPHKSAKIEEKTSENQIKFEKNKKNSKNF